MTNSRFFSGSLSRLLLLLLVVTLAACSSDEPPSPLPRQGSACDSDPVRFPRFKTNSSQLTIFQTSSCSYIPITLTGVNLGVATPGKYAGDLDSAATYADFLRWFQLMVDAGINVVRVYTLHMDFFYDALYDFNTQREIDGLSPLYLMQGVWLEENDTAEDFYDHTVSMSTNTFEVINAVYGNTTLSASGRPGKGYGTYTSNVSDWTIAWLMGREISPPEVSVTNSHIPLVDNYRGFILSLPNGSATEAWVTARMDDMLTYEVVNYSKTRPISFSSWPTLDPLTHPTENLIQNSNYEDREKLDLGNIDDSKAPAGVFISYHAYPYYPDFVSEDLNYRSYSDGSGANSYLGYLTALKAHYANKPVIIAEFGAPSSWGDVHASHSGMHHGGHDETTQGTYAGRMLNNIVSAGMGGGLLFSWIDEWWKPTWLTNQFDFPGGRRLYWHNLMAPEQNYGLIKFTPVTPAYTVLKQQDGSTAWAGTNITSVSASADVAYYHLDLGLATGLNTSDELMVVLDTYDDPVTSANRWGESQISNAISSKIGGTPLSTTQRSEFLIRLFHNGSNWRAQLYVTEAYDLYPLFGGNHDPLVQQLQSTVTDGAPWIPVKWKTNNADYATEPDTFYGTVGNSESLVGQLTVKESTESASSKDAVVLSGSNIDIHLPWSLLHFSDPSQRQVFHDDKTSTDTWNESVPSAGIANAVIFNGGLEGETERYSWNTWMDNPSVDSMTSLYTEQTKASYNLYKTAIQAINP